MNAALDNGYRPPPVAHDALGSAIGATSRFFFDYEQCEDVLSWGCGLQGAGLLPVGKLGKLGKLFRFSDEAPRAIGAAERFSVHGRVAAQLDDVRLGPLAGRYRVDDLQSLMHSPGSRAYFDTATRNMNVVREVDGVLLRITTAGDEFRIISVGRLRQAQLQNGISNGRFVPIESGG
jgi:hypothetical protein